MSNGKKLQKMEAIRRIKSFEKEAAAPKHLRDYVPPVVGYVSSSVPVLLGARLLFDFYLMNDDLKKIEKCKETLRTSNSVEVREEAAQTLERLSRSVDKRFYINMGVTGLILWWTR